MAAPQIAVAALPDRRLELWATDRGGGLQTTWKVDTDPNANWSGWSDFLAEVGPLANGVGNAAVAPLPDGRLELWAADGQGGLFTTWKVDTDPNANWSGWSDFRAEMPLPAAFVGAATFTIDDSRFPGPFTAPLALTPTFSADRSTVELGPFPSITVGPFATPIGMNTITVTQTRGGSGTFDKSAGTLTMPITLNFDHSLAVVGDSTVAFNLTTGSSASPSGVFRPTGVPLNRTTGVIVLVAGSRFRGGFLNGTDCSVTITGTLSPLP